MRRGIIIVAAGLAAIAGIMWFAGADSIATEPKGSADACQQAPPFIGQYPEISQPAFDTSRRDLPGLVLTDTAEGETDAVQRDSWRQFGSLGPIVRDEHGAVYTATVPVVNTISADRDSHLAVLRLDPQTGELAHWLTLHGEQPGGQNFYGITSLAYDCSSKLLYVAAIAGSSRDEERGFIAVVDVPSRTEKFRYEGIDALGIGIFGGSEGRHIYVGSARTSDVVRLGLTSAGKPFGEPEHVLEFDEFNRTRARKLTFTARDMSIGTTEFYYNLVASTEFDQRQLKYEYDQTNDDFRPYDD